MLTREENELLTRVGPGTPMGGLMRRYWHPVAAVAEMAGTWTKRVTLLGEELVLYRNRSGEFGLIEESCPHRRASLFYGIPTAAGLRCPYHGWEFDRTGTCVEQPNEPAESTFKNKVCTPSYPVEELGGLLFAYLGPEPRPLVPRLDGYVAAGAIRMIGRAVVPCNWLQIMENSVDPVHTEWLHGQLHEFQREEQGEKVAIARHHLKIGFDEFDYGIYKRRLLEGQSEDADDWKTGHPMVFPTILAVGNAGPGWRMHAFQIRVPRDDTHTLHLWYNAYVPLAGARVPQKLLDEVPVYDVPFLDAQGNYLIDLIDAQDIMAWVSQGPIADRSRETLGSSDRGVTLLRRMLRRELQKVANGEDPIGVIRDPERNHVALHVEQAKAHYADGFENLVRRTRIRYSPVVEELIGVFAPLAHA
ncbi:MAG TPA: Rieske 2Fe-2S domain-containing protein [Candidatus Lustribacter sp.]